MADVLMVQLIAGVIFEPFRLAQMFLLGAQT
jgi:hypothetical protein